jgi:hypothetical protein
VLNTNIAADTERGNGLEKTRSGVQDLNSRGLNTFGEY